MQELRSPVHAAIQSLDSPVCDRCFIFLKSKEFTLKFLVIETVIDKVDQIRADCLSAFCFQKFCQMIVCSRKEFDKDFSDDANTWFLFVCDWQGVNSRIIWRQIRLNCAKLAMFPETNSIQRRSHLRCRAFAEPFTDS